MKARTSRPVLALFSPASNAASETFIKAHRDKVDAEVLFYTDGLVPTRLNNQPFMRFKYQLKYYFVKKIFKTTLLTLDEFALKESLKLQKPHIVLCEYGPTANDSLRVIRELKLPLLVYFHGYDMSIRAVIEHYGKYTEVIKYAEKIFVVSRDMEKRVIDFGAKPDQVIYNPCAPSDEYFKILPTQKAKKIFVAAGRFTNKKAPYLTLLSFKGVLTKYPDAKLIIAGDGDLYQVCRDMAAYHNIQKSIELPGQYNEAQLKGWLKDAVAFVQHSVTAESGDQEGTPVAILEAMASGLPIISTKHAGIKDIVENSSCGYLVDEYDIEGMTQKMCEILNDTKSAHTMGLNAREYVANNLTMEKHIGKINKVILGILK